MFFIWFDDMSELGTGAFTRREWRWCRTGPGSRVEGSGDLEKIADLLTSQDDEVNLLLAARECVHLQLKVPPMSARSLKQALPFIAEEQVAQPVERMHFAMGERRGEYTACLGISKSLLRHLLEILSQYGISPTAAYSDASLLRIREGSVGMLLDGERALVRTANLSLEASRQDVCNYLDSIVQEFGEPSSELTIEVISDESAHIPDGLAESSAKITQRRISRGPLAELLSTQLSEINLLVSEFEPGTAKKRNGVWRLPIALAASFLALIIASHLSVGLIELNRSQALQMEALSFVEGATSPDEVVRLIHREQGTRSQETRDFLILLAQISKVSAGRGANLRTLSYQSGSGVIDIEVLVADYDALDAFSNDAQSAFRQADMLGATQTGEGVRARLRLLGVGQ